MHYCAIHCIEHKIIYNKHQTEKYNFATYICIHVLNYFNIKYTVKDKKIMIKSPIDVEIFNIRKVINEYPILRMINNHISKNKILNCSQKSLCKGKITKSSYHYVFDGLNIEGGNMNSFIEIKKILNNKKNNLLNKKILIIIRSPLKYQTKKEREDCKKLVKKNSNVNIIYIHTLVKIKDNYYKLIASCKDNPYCTHKEKKNRELLCVTPLLIALGMRPLHNMCEIDDLLIYYFTLCFNSKVVSRTENYSLNVKAININSFKLFMNIPITFYNSKTEKKLYINSLEIYKNLSMMYEHNRLTEKQVIKIKNRNTLP